MTAQMCRWTEEEVVPTVGLFDSVMSIFMLYNFFRVHRENSVICSSLIIKSDQRLDFILSLQADILF